MSESRASSGGEELSLRVRGLRLKARAWGPVEGRPVLALHGWLDNAASFDTLAPLLPELRVVALDCPGHGLSEHLPPSAGYQFVDWLPLPFEVADQFGWQRFSLLGHSMGAGIASLAAGVFPERLEHVVLLDALGPLTAPPELGPRLVRRHLERRPLAARRPAVYPDRQSAAARLVRAVPGLSPAGALLLVKRGTRPAGERASASPAAAEPARAESEHHEHPAPLAGETAAALGGAETASGKTAAESTSPGASAGWVWRADPRLRLPSPLPLTEQQTLAFLSAITAPCLLIGATAGIVPNTDALPARMRCVRDLTYKLLEGGHHLHLDAPEVVAPSIRRFFGLPPLPG